MRMPKEYKECNIDNHDFSRFHNLNSHSRPGDNNKSFHRLSDLSFPGRPVINTELEVLSLSPGLLPVATSYAGGGGVIASAQGTTGSDIGGALYRRDGMAVTGGISPLPFGAKTIVGDVFGPMTIVGSWDWGRKRLKKTQPAARRARPPTAQMIAIVTTGDELPSLLIP